jgi:RND family efflux transporter MFP subunit
MGRRFAVVMGFLALGLACRAGDAKKAAEAPEGWSVTAWGERYEVFAETGPLVAGQTATSNAHVTVLDGFAPLRQGTVSVLLRPAGGQEEAFRQTQPKREGIFPVELKPRAEGTFALVFRIESAAGTEDVPAGQVRVGSAATPGGSVAQGSEPSPGGISFLKEQQWRTEFATAWVREGAMAEAVEGPAQVKPAAGGEVVLTAPVDATVASSPWPHVGLDLAEGGAVFSLLPRVGGKSLPELRAEASALEADVEVARKRLERLTELLRVEATSQAELERARATLKSLEARLAFARGGVAPAGGGERGGGSLSVQSPWGGRVAEVSVSPGQTVAAGATLGRLVKLRPVWLAVALRPESAARVQAAPASVFLKRPGSSEPVQVSGKDVRLVSRAPVVDARTATVDVILELARSASDLPFGSAVEAQLLLSGEQRGVVVPVLALVDDSGTSVAYVQVEGESFARRELRVLRRLGSEALVEGLKPGQRLVTRGAASVRRASLLSTGAPEGHVH